MSDANPPLAHDLERNVWIEIRHGETDIEAVMRRRLEDGYSQPVVARIPAAPLGPNYPVRLLLTAGSVLSVGGVILGLVEKSRAEFETNVAEIGNTLQGANGFFTNDAANAAYGVMWIGFGLGAVGVVLFVVGLAVAATRGQ